MDDLSWFFTPVDHSIKHIYNNDIVRTSLSAVKLFIVVILVGIVLAVTILVRTGHLETGFSGRTLWDWLEVIGMPVIVVIIAVLFLFKKRKRMKINSPNPNQI